jgi:N-acetylneuraminic acid mutarotase
MTEQTLGAGSTTRRRVLFGLLAADGWSWAGLKALFWFIVIILLLGYIPDRAYYFTVFSTIDLGINAVSPINFCPPANSGLPCPPPPGSVLPWQPAPSELALPAPRMDGSLVQAGIKLMYVGGTDGKTTSDQVFTADAFASGTFSSWSTGPTLPAPRSRAATIFLNGSIYVIGGFDAAGKPTNTIYILTPDPQTGALPPWKTAREAALSIDLPDARAGASVVVAPDGLILIGGYGPDGKPTTTVWKSTADKTGKLQAWTPTTELGDARADATAAINGPYLYLFGGSNASGPTASVLRGDVAADRAGVTQVTRWGASVGSSNLPAPRSDAAGFIANGTFYLVGGTDGTTPHNELYWTVPDATGNIGEWKRLAASDLPPPGLVGSRAMVNGATAFIVGGQTDTAVITGAARANLAPQPPFFQLGLVGATIPALQIQGEVGQQLGYLAAATVGAGNFILLLLIGWAFAHPVQVRAMWGKIRQHRHKT